MTQQRKRSVGTSCAVAENGCVTSSRRLTPPRRLVQTHLRRNHLQLPRPLLRRQLLLRALLHPRNLPLEPLAEIRHLPLLLRLDLLHLLDGACALGPGFSQLARHLLLLALDLDVLLAHSLEQRDGLGALLLLLLCGLLRLCEVGFELAELDDVAGLGVQVGLGGRELLAELGDEVGLGGAFEAVRVAELLDACFLHCG